MLTTDKNLYTIYLFGKKMDVASDHKFSSDNALLTKDNNHILAVQEEDGSIFQIDLSNPKESCVVIPNAHGAIKKLRMTKDELLLFILTEREVQLYDLRLKDT